MADLNGINKAASALVSQIFKSDANKDGKLSGSEYTNFVVSKSGNGSPTAAAIAGSFSQIDKNTDGSITEAEATAFFSPPQIDTSSLLSSGTTASLLSALTQENASSANAPADLVTQLLSGYTSSSKKLGGSFSGEA